MNPLETSRDVLNGAKVAVTGRFSSMTHAELAELIREHGGQFVHTPSQQTTYVVVGQEGLPLEADGQPTVHLAKARQIQASGLPLRIVPEETFFAMLGLEPVGSEVQRRYTVAQLHRILGVPGERIRAWMRAGLITPAETANRLHFFDFHQVASAKTICELAASRVPLARIREGLEQLRKLLPGEDYPLAQIAALERNPRMLVRMVDGKLAEPNGQLHFDFEEPPRDDDVTTVRFLPSGDTADDWFGRAVQLEEDGRLAEAREAYVNAVDADGHQPVYRFNLGNLLFRLDDYQAARDCFQAAIALDPNYVEAWNNLGSTFMQLGETPDAAVAYEHALEITPNYADAYYNLAEAFRQLGRIEEARSCWTAYLEFDSTSPWADEARQHLEEHLDEL